MRARTPLRAIALVVVAAAALSGCSDDEAVPLAEVDSIDDRIAAMPGVEDATATANAVTGRIDLEIALAADIARPDLEAVGREAAAFGDSITPEGTFPGSAEIRLGDSIFAYFGAGGAEQVNAQLGYWLDLARVGFERVAMRDLADYGAPDEQLGDADAGDAAAAGDAGATAPEEAAPRYVLLDLPDDADPAGAEGIFARARALADPGAAAGEWEITGFGDQARLQLAQPGIAGSEQVRQLGEFGEAVSALDEHATIRLRSDAAATPPLDVEMTLFDDSLEHATSDDVERRLIEGPMWPALDGIIAELDHVGADYDFDLLANPLADGGNFELEVSVRDCLFRGDPDWPQASDELGAGWLAHRASSDPISVATGACAVADEG